MLVIPGAQLENLSFSFRHEPRRVLELMALKAKGIVIEEAWSVGSASSAATACGRP